MAQDDILKTIDETSRYKAEDFGFNAIDLRQTRFLYGDSMGYRNRRFYENISIGAVWHYDKIHERIPQGYEPTLNYGLFVEKELNKIHALRLLFHGGSYQQSVRPVRLNKYQIELMHSFNWTRYFGGYNPYRKLDAVTNIGVGAFYSKRVGEVELGPMLIMGAGARIQLNPLFALGIDPYLALVSDRVDHSGDINHHRYDLLYGTNVSLAYTLHRKEVRDSLWPRYKDQSKTFVDFGIGLQLEPYTGFHFHSSSVPFFATPGPKFKLGIGHWMTPAVALRATVNLSSSNWDNAHLEANTLTNHPAYDIKLKNVLTNGQLDLIVTPCYLFTNRENNLFDINAIVGWEYGWMIKTAYNPANLLSTYYDGFSGGLQLRFNYDKQTAIYLEPRLTLANYSIPYAEPYEEYIKRYRDYLFSMTAGLEFSTNEYRFLKRKNQPSKFNPHLSLSLQGGPNYMFVTKEHVGNFYIDYSTGISGELQMSPYSGMRVMADYSLLSNRDIYHYTQRLTADEGIILSDTALCTGKYGFVNLSADYVFDLGTLLQGYGANNKWDVAIAVGAVYSQRVREKAIISKEEMLWEFRGDNPVATVPIVDHSRVTDHSFGFQVGIPVSYRINSHWDILFEPRARFFPSNYVEQAHSQGNTKILNTQIGLRYTLGDRYSVMHNDSLDGHFKLLPGHLFAHMAVGTQTSQALNDRGPRIETGIGYWFNPGVAARASINLTSHDWKRHQEKLPYPTNGDEIVVETSLRQLNGNGRIDLILAPYGYLKNRYDNPFGLNFLAGWEFGTMLRGNMTETLVDKYNAFSVGAQLRYNHDSYRTLYIEPRYTYNFTTKSNQYSVVAGMELGATQNVFRPKRGLKEAFSPKLSVSILGGLGYIYNGKEYSDAPISDYTGAVVTEYTYSPYSGVRLGIGYTGYQLRGLHNYSQNGQFSFHSIGYMNIGIDYMLDITTLLQGYTEDRVWNAALALGPTYSIRVAHSEHMKTARKHQWGIQAGTPVSYRINASWRVWFEPRVKVASRHLFNLQSRFPFAQYDALWGVKYTF